MVKTLMILGASIMLIKFLIFIGILKLKSVPKSKLYAEDIIACKGYHPNQYKNMMNNIIVDKTRDSEIEQEYLKVKNLFNHKLKNRELNRGQILGLKDYLTNNLKIYDKKKFNSDAHAIYTMLKAYDIQHKHLETIKEFLLSA